MLDKRGLVAIAGVLVLGGALAVHFSGRQAPGHPSATEAAGSCPVTVTKAELVKSVELGTRYVLAHQRESGNFDYIYDWKAKTYANEDSDVRQAGALWALALLQQFEGPPKAPPELRPALEKGLLFFDKAAAETPRGGRYPVYAAEGSDSPGTGGVGTAALLTLAVVDYLRGLPPDAKAERDLWTARSSSYIKFLVDSRDDKGLWYGKFHYDGGAAFSAHSPYSDGEALLALVLAMKYLGREDLAPVVEKAAERGHRVNIEEALAQKADSDTTKGFYQWSSMAYYELSTSKWGKNAPYGDWLLALADWMLDVHRVIEKPRNTGYAYEGLVSAYAWAKEKGDTARTSKYECAIHRGLANLMSWQVGHPRAADLGPSDDPKALGGVQNHKTEPGLRIDVTQHQMHATMLAIHHLFP
jgi:UDP-N-acetylmuramoyl-tripeptide--D-alanyl-D-alanine ligase